MKVRCVCDLCEHGIQQDRKCYSGGITKCLKNGIYKHFKLKKESQDEIDWKSRYEELDQYIKETYGDY